MKTETMGRKYYRRKAGIKGREVRAKVVDLWRYIDSPRKEGSGRGGPDVCHDNLIVNLLSSEP